MTKQLRLGEEEEDDDAGDDAAGADDAGDDAAGADDDDDDGDASAGDDVVAADDDDDDDDASGTLSNGAALSTSPSISFPPPSSSPFSPSSLDVVQCRATAVSTCANARTSTEKLLKKNAKEKQ